MDLIETASEVVERAQRGRLHSRIAIMVAATATFMALCNVKDGNIVQTMAQHQANEMDKWAYYQAKSTKQNIAAAALDILETQRTSVRGAADAEERNVLEKKIAGYRADVERYQREKNEIKAEAEALKGTFDRLNVHDDQLDMATALMSIALSLFGVAALTNKPWMLGLASVFAGLGVVLGLAAFTGLNLHPSFLAKLLG